MYNDAKIKVILMIINWHYLKTVNMNSALIYYVKKYTSKTFTVYILTYFIFVKQFVF